MTEIPWQAVRQRGVFTSAQAIEGGLSAWQVRHRLSTGRWHRVLGRGVSAHAPPATGWPAHTLAWAAVLTWSDAVVSHHVAGVIHGFPVRIVEPVRVYTHTNHHRRPGLLAHRTPPADHLIVEPDPGLRITCIARTAIDLLAVLPAGAADDLYAWLDAHGRLGRGQLTEAVRRHTGRRGVGRLRDLQRRTAAGAVSEAERRMHMLLRRARIEGWSAGARIFDAQGLVGVVDLLFEAERVVVEIDGWRAHSGPAAFQRDRRRQNRLLLAGYVVLRFTWDDITTRPDAVAEEVRRALHRPGTGMVTFL
jgi:very-short-patch-repair endonuclease